MAVTTLPPERLKRNVIANDSPVTIKVYVGKLLLLQLLVRNKGTCQVAHRTPSRREALKGPSRTCKRGRAKPLHPGSSPSGPPNNVEMEKTDGESRLLHRSADQGPAVSTSAGITTKVVTISNGETIALTRAAFSVHVVGVGQRCCVIRSVINAPNDGAKLPATVITGRESSKGSQPSPARESPSKPKKIQAIV
jgi:hypothetical protein